MSVGEYLIKMSIYAKNDTQGPKRVKDEIANKELFNFVVVFKKLDHFHSYQIFLFVITLATTKQVFFQ